MPVGDGLHDYRSKRDFRRTPEPRGQESNQAVGRPRFVVHRHDARNLHYDLRIEIDPTRVASFAIPRGFDYRPKSKKLAIHTEDHPIEYLTFEGTIPRGEYGGGTMTIWDHGECEVVYPTAVESGIAEGKLELRLFGRRLRGEWHMVRTRGDADVPIERSRHWLLFKARDRYAAIGSLPAIGFDLSRARGTALPARRRWMRASADSEGPSDDARWLHEVELIGDRVQVRKDGSVVKILGPRRYAGRGFATLRESLAGLRAEAALVDAMIVAENPRTGHPDREALADAEAGEVVVWAFDLLHFEDFDLRDLPLVQRKAALQAVVAGVPQLQFVDHVVGSGHTMAAQIADLGLRGLVAKRGDSRYRAGRQADWRRIDVSAVAGHQQPAMSSKVRFTHRNKIYWPQEGYTKGDLLRYYADMAEVLLPHLVDRPVHLNRFPDGIDGESFYQHELPDPVPDWVDYRVLPHSGDSTKRHVVCQSRETLLYLVQLGSIDLHPWLSRLDDLDRPDRLVFDLDPKHASFRDVVRVARELGRLLHALELEPTLGTSGKTGLHIALHILPTQPYRVIGTFAEAVARMVVRALPEICTVERVVAARGNKVYVDTLQNRRGMTVVAPYTVRPHPGATVATPLHWDELDSGLDPAEFNITTVPSRVQTLGDLAERDPARAIDLIDVVPKLERLITP